MLAWVCLGYALGSVPFAFLLARRAGIDVRVAGSGNVGAANVLRTASAPLGIATVVLDVSKGAAAVLIAQSITGTAAATAAAGVAAIVGHIYPVWLRFHGGKGVAVAAGVFGVLTPLATLAALAVFSLVVFVTRFVSLGSIAASVTLPPVATFAGAPRQVLLATCVSSGLILFRHRSNLRRLVERRERRIGERSR
jgi:acyl phosphate:glycerol-3-phosphate acyltransferase